MAFLYPSLVDVDMPHLYYWAVTSWPSSSSPWKNLGALKSLFLLKYLQAQKGLHVHSVNPRPYSYATKKQK